MQKKKHLRVNYRINHYSSEDPEYPVSQLLLQSPDAKGWQSKRFCSYPQIIVIQLVEIAVLKQISILSHQSKISTKVEIQTKLDANKQWKRLGFMSLQSNANTNYQARQLRTVKINDISSLMLRFTFHTNYVNNHNIFNQVGIISLCAFGDKMVSGRETPNLGPIPMDLDKNTMNRLKALEIQKKQAIENQDYDRAKTIKQEIERLKNTGYVLSELEQKKQEAIRNQNYEDAKIINEKIKKIRDLNGGGPNFSSRPSGSSSDYYRQNGKISRQQDNEDIAISPNTPINITKSSPKPPLKSAMVNNNVRSTKQIDEGRQIQKINFEEIPITVKNQNPYENADEDEQQEKISGNEPAGQLQPLNKQLRSQCSEFFSIMDQEIFRQIFSKHHLNRENGLQSARAEIQGSNKSRQLLASAGLFIVKNTIDDKNIAVLTSSLNLFTIILKKCKPSNNSTNSALIQNILDKLADHLGHNNEKLRQTTEDVFLELPNFQTTHKELCYKVLTTLNPKRDKPPKVLTGRLKVLSGLVESYQLGRNYEQVVRYAAKYADDKNSQVRSAAIILICSICKELGYPTVQDYLKNVRPQIIKSIQEKLGQTGLPVSEQRPIKPQNNTKARNNSRDKPKKQQQEQNQNQFMDRNPTKAVNNKEYQCQFCQRFDKRFQNENYRDLHLFNACPMLVVCEECKQAVEIKSFTSHLMGECKNSKYYKKCPRCKQAVHQKNYKVHAESKQCIPSKPPSQANRCPLCHLDIEAGQDGWRLHLAQEGCDNNPRK